MKKSNLERKNGASNVLEKRKRGYEETQQTKKTDSLNLSRKKKKKKGNNVRTWAEEGGGKKSSYFFPSGGEGGLGSPVFITKEGRATGSGVPKDTYIRRKKEGESLWVKEGQNKSSKRKKGNNLPLEKEGGLGKFKTGEGG